MRELDLRHLRVIDTIAEAGSLCKAAAQLGLSQPALTAQLHRIEHRVGSALFTRSNLGVAPTELGRLVLAQARVVLADLANLNASITRYQRPAPSTEVDTVRVVGYAGPLLIAFNTRLGKELGAQIEVTGENSVAAVCQKVLDGADFGLLAAHEEFAAPIPQSLHRLMIVDEPIYIAVPAEHVLAASETIRLADLADEDWIFCPTPDDDGLNPAFFRACSAAGFAPRIAHHAEGSVLARDLVAAGTVGLFQGVASRTDRRVVFRPLTGHPIRAQIHLVWRPETSNVDRACDAMFEAYQDVLTELPAHDRRVLEEAIRSGARTSNESGDAPTGG